MRSLPAKCIALVGGEANSRRNNIFPQVREVPVGLIYKPRNVVLCGGITATLMAKCKENKGLEDLQLVGDC